MTAWICDDKFEKGVREYYDTSMTRTVIKEINDHHFVDLRLFPLGWPLKDRRVMLGHIRMELEDGSFCQLSRSIELPLEELKGIDYYDKDSIAVDYESLFWVKKVDENSCEMMLSAYSDPKGHIPQWIILDIAGRCSG